MTHMTNYGNDQLALYAISRLVNFVHRWTNLELKYASPIELADIYFNLFPKDKVPIWLVSDLNLERCYSGNGHNVPQTRKNTSGPKNLLTCMMFIPRNSIFDVENFVIKKHI